MHPQFTPDPRHSPHWAMVAHLTPFPGRERLLCASYVRTSHGMGGHTAFSLGHQDWTLEEWAEAMGWDLPQALRFADGETRHASGAKWNLPGLMNMLEAARRREFQILLVYDTDRFARGMTKALVLEEQLKAYGVVVLYQRLAHEDTPEGRLLKRSIQSHNEFEREKIGLRTHSGRRRKVDLGMVLGGGKAPYGYRFRRSETLTNRSGAPLIVSLEPDPVAAPVVRKIFDDLLTRSLREVLDDLLARGVPAPKGPRWCKSSLVHVAKNRVYRGTWSYGEQTVAVPPLVDPALFDEVQRTLERRKPERPPRDRGGWDPFPLRGRLRCGHCGGAMHTRARDGGPRCVAAREGRRPFRYYGCDRHAAGEARRLGKPVCPMMQVTAEDLEDELRRTLGEVLLDPRRLKRALGAEVARHERGDRLIADRLAATERALKAERARLANVVGSQSFHAPKSAAWETLQEQVVGLGRTVDRLTAERDELAGQSAEGMTKERAAVVEATAGRLRARYRALKEATLAELCELVAELDVRAVIRQEAGGLPLGRGGREYAIEWKARLRLDNRLSNNEQDYQYDCALPTSPDPAPGQPLPGQALPGQPVGDDPFAYHLLLWRSGGPGAAA
jgi:site-specific DNA recombinase